MTAAERLLNWLAQSTTPRELIVAAGLLGLMYDDFGVQILRLPRPAEIQDDPQLAQIYDDALEGSFAPMLQQAGQHYEYCEQRPGAPDWSAFCAQRLAALRGSGRVAPAAPGSPAG